jgi:uncharacterized protein (DUF305 family)
MKHLPLSLVSIVLVAGLAESQTQPPIVQPGAPGERSRAISAKEASDLAGTQYTEADVRFMQGMISQDAQALEMTALVATRAERDALRELAKSIELARSGDIPMMQEWLRGHGQTMTAADAHHAQGFEPLPGMATSSEMSRLEQARGLDFDRQFLELMLRHHRGALSMVEQFLAQAGAAQDPKLYDYATELASDHSSEMERMDSLLREILPDPRATLRPGFRDAGEAAFNLERVATLAKPDGFFDPLTPAGRPIPPEKRPGDDRKKKPEKPADAQAAAKAKEAAKRRRQRKKRTRSEGLLS